MSAPVSVSKPSAGPAEPGPVAVARGTRGTRVGGLVLLAVVVLLAIVPYTYGQDVTASLVDLFVLVVIGTTWNLLAGYGGLASFGQQAFIGVGAYTELYLSLQGVNPYVALPCAAVAAAIVAVPTSVLVFRLRGGYFAIGTWVVSEVFLLLVKQWDYVGQGTGKSIKGLSSLDPAQRQADTYWEALALTVIVVLVTYLILRSRTGLALTAIRDDDTAAGSLGVRVSRVKRAVYVLASAGAGAAGAVIAINALYVQPDNVFTINWSVDMLFIVVIGGVGTIEGPIVGAIIYYVLQRNFADHGVYYLIGLGALAVVVTLYLPRGVWGLVADRTPLRLFPVGYTLRRPGRSHKA